MHFLIDPKLLLALLVGTWAGTIGTTVLIGGGIAGGIAASKKKKKEPTVIKSPYDTPEMQQYQKSLQERLLGRGLPQSVLDNAVSPFATSARDTFTKYTVPTIKSAASAAGLSRSTIVPAQIGQKSLENQQTIDQRLADMMYKNELFKLQDKLNAEQELAGVGTGKTAVENARLTENARARDVARARTDESFNKYLSGVGGFIGGGVGGAATGYAGGGSSKFGGYDLNDLGSLMDLLGGGSAGTVKTGVNTNMYSPITKPKLSYSYAR